MTSRFVRMLLASAVFTAACASGNDTDPGDDETADIIDNNDSSDDDPGDDDPNDGGDSNDDPVESEAYQYVQESVTLPMSGTDFALDLDNDGEVDNALGEVLKLLADYHDIQAEVDNAIESGDLVLLHELTSTSLSSAVDATWQVFLGDSVGTPDFSGGGSFSISDGSTFDGSIVEGDVSGGEFYGGPGTVTIALSLAAGLPPTEIELVGARIKTDVDENGCEGIIAGAITEDEMEETVIPSLALAMNAYIENAPNSSDSQTMLELFDTNGNGTISESEFANNFFVIWLLSPDVDLFDDTGVFHPGSDGNNDSFSLGIGFTCVPASF